jgi:hypothetical protein
VPQCNILHKPYKYFTVVYSSVADPDLFDTDPDPPFHFDTDPAFQFDPDPTV